MSVLPVEQFLMRRHPDLVEQRWRGWYGGRGVGTEPTDCSIGNLEEMKLGPLSVVTLNFIVKTLITGYRKRLTSRTGNYRWAKGVLVVDDLIIVPLHYMPACGEGQSSDFWALLLGSDLRRYRLEVRCCNDSLAW
jgi:hypothetical protein